MFCHHYSTTFPDLPWYRFAIEIFRQVSVSNSSFWYRDNTRLWRPPPPPHSAVDRLTRWGALLSLSLLRHGVRNSLLLAPMPTASTAQILGNNESVEAYTSNIYTRRVLSGEFQVHKSPSAHLFSCSRFFMNDLVLRCKPPRSMDLLFCSFSTESFSCLNPTDCKPSPAEGPDGEGALERGHEEPADRSEWLHPGMNE